MLSIPLSLLKRWISYLTASIAPVCTVVRRCGMPCRRHQNTKLFSLECLEWLDCIHSLGKRHLPHLKGWKMAISCLLGLWEDLHNNHGVKYLLTNQLNQNCVENLFSETHRDNPDVSLFRAAFRQVMVDYVMLPLPEGSNCKEDVDSFLLNLKSIGALPANAASLPTPTLPSSLPPVVQSLLSVFNLPQGSSLSLQEPQIIAYIAGYICRKVRSKVCEDCRDKLRGSGIDPNNPAHLLLKKRALWGHLWGGSHCAQCTFTQCSRISQN